jgi:peptidoglycan/xylan/chitin deacetylase (PgdA/CDA1 family)
MLSSVSKKVKRYSKKLRNKALFKFGVPFHYFTPDEKNIIIMYHGVCQKINPYNSRHCYLHDFERQLRYLKTAANIVSLEDFFLGKFEKNRTNIAITFDDGYLNNLENALPLLEKFNVKASIYITGLGSTEDKIIWADFLQISCFRREKSFELRNEEYEIKNKVALRKSDGKALLEIVKLEKAEYAFKQEIYEVLKNDFEKVKGESSEYWQLMNDEEIKKMAASPMITIGSHGFGHNNLGTIDFIDAQDEVKKSKEYLQNLIQTEVKEIAFPDGSYSPEVLDFCKESGFEYQLAAGYFIKPEDQNVEFLRKRYGVYQIGNWSEQITFK